MFKRTTELSGEGLTTRNTSDITVFIPCNPVLVELEPTERENMKKSELDQKF